jgi:hypothetical protein
MARIGGVGACWASLQVMALVEVVAKHGGGVVLSRHAGFTMHWKNT